MSGLWEAEMAQPEELADLLKWLLATQTCACCVLPGMRHRSRGLTSTRCLPCSGWVICHWWRSRYAQHMPVLT